MDRFEYTPLNPERKEIRLLTFEDDTDAGIPDDTKPLRCTVNIVSPFDTPKVSYNAISYCWGENPPLERIILNGKEAMVPVSAIRALRTVCHPVHGRRNLPVWIDAVCINQTNDDEEKNHQVAMMGDVYANASETLVWLGEEDSTTEASFQAVNAILQSLSDGKVTDETPLLSTSVWTDALKWFDSTWFCRLWPVQEVVRATCATCWRGRFSIDWEAVGILDPVLRKSRATSYDLSFNLLQAGMIADIKRWDDVSLDELLLCCADLKTSDPRDKIYAVLGILDLTEWPSDLVELMKPDYTLSVKDVYTRATIAAIRSTGRLSILESAQINDPGLRFRSPEARDGDYYDVPSWVRRYDLPMNRTMFPVTPIASGCAGIMKHGFAIDPQTETTLHVRGVILEEVHSINPSVHKFMFDEFKTPGGASKFMHCFRTLFELARDVEGASLLEHVKQIAPTCAWIRASERPSTEQTENIVAGFAAFMLTFKDYWIGSSDTLESCLMEIGCKQGNAQRYANDMWRASSERHLVKISTRRYGMAPLYTKPGDVICILFGCEAPLILRPKGNDHEGNSGEFWEIIGDVYVHGIVEVSERD